MADQRRPELNPVVTPALTDILAVRQTADSRDKRETIAQALSLYVEVNDLTAAVVWANIPDANVPETAVTQHVGALEHSSLLNVPATISQAEAEAGTATTDRLFTAERVEQAISALGGTGDVTKVGTPADNQIGVWTGDGTLEGASNLTWDGSQMLLPSDNDAVTPTLAFGDGDTGFYEENAASDLIVFSCAGVGVIYLHSSGLLRKDTSGFAISTVTPTAIIPNIIPARTDDDTGMGWAAADALSLIAGGVEGIRVTEAAAAITVAIAGDTVVTGGIRTSIAFGPELLNEAASTVNPTVIPNKDDPDTGLSGNGVDQCILVAGGVQMLQAREVSGSNQIVLVPGIIDNNSALPTLAFGDGDTGFYESANDVLKISCGGIDQWAIFAGAFQGEVSGAPRIANETSSATNPTINPSSAASASGLGYPGGNAFSLIAASVEIARVEQVSGPYNQFIIAPGVIQNAASKPSLAFGDGDTGFYENSANYLSVAISGVREFVWGTGSFSGIISGAGAIRNEETSLTNPTLLPSANDQTTGIGATLGSPQLSLIAGGVSGLHLTELNSGILYAPQAQLAITAFATGGQGSATQIDSSYVVISVCATGGDSVKLPASFAVNTVIHIKNDGAQACDVFPGSGDDLGAGADTAASLAAAAGIAYIATVADTTWTKLA